MHAIKINQLCKKYKSLQALKGLDLEIEEGEFFGLLGPNGAGKTTLIGSVVGLVKPDSGQISVFGKQVSPQTIDTRQMIGFAPQEINVDRFFNIRKTLEFQAGFYGFSHKYARERTQDLLTQFRLKEKSTEPFYKLSGGMQRRLLIARALISKPKILILDEPTAGVDVEQRRELWSYLQNLNEDGTTILLTTHYIDEAELLCERVAIINHGQIIEMGRPRELIAKYCKEKVEITFRDKLHYGDFKGFSEIKMEDNRLTLTQAKVGIQISELLERANLQGANPVLDMQVCHGSLEDVFVTLTGRKL
ncbi:MAG: ABC transporter ATP-binding protein [Deltaproteobacteria bacterium]|nr:ABC transporter ATP-binding protein [Deltaproteobacteria bacterium]